MVYIRCLPVCIILVLFFFTSTHGGLGYNEQVACLSWWPRNNIFLGSGLWPGYWSQGCEDWFQRQYSSILQQDAKFGMPRTSAQWQNALKFEKDVRCLRIANSVAAAAYLDRSRLLH